MRFIFKLSCCFIVLLSQFAHAQTYSKQEIQHLAQEHAESIFPKNDEEELKAQASAIDSRIKIKPCQQALSLSAPNFSSFSRNLTVRVRCLDEEGWSLYVPIRLKVLVPIVVASTNIAKGDTLSASNVKRAKVDKTYARKDQITDEKLVIGSKAKRQIRSGQAILNSNLCFVCKGELVTIQAKTKGLSVKTSGIALSDGAFGDVISVRNTSSKRTVQGRVVGVGKIEISL
ncbi:flagellar basal body P-ring formation protein FlgA [Catenovulum sp. SM1970]|uniref:flagellar basal body P-ring formation chaperone FlgA n=1 Tax=Marinifaba aquimaris TaxID=2741323 RepID=UPI0015742151|nr:flagellar basal body P-ring formation chaperone FlgA [Marinifaba aquimaris]NTS75407.1 flagellar basal body P-ring formation protein FlgA [Marinifaba aquimaris]